MTTISFTRTTGMMWNFVVNLWWVGSPSSFVSGTKMPPLRDVVAFDSPQPMQVLLNHWYVDDSCYGSRATRHQHAFEVLKVWYLATETIDEIRLSQ